MITIDKYIKPNSIKECYETLKDVPNSEIIAGGIFLKLSSKKIDTLIDLYDLNMNYIKEDKESVEIGAMTTFRDIEMSKIIKENFGDILSDSVKDVVGVQFKNSVTVGGSIYPKYGFSDLLTALLVLDCKVVLYKMGEISLEEFLNRKIDEKDILLKIVIKKQNISASFKSLRNSAGDYSILNCAVSNENGKFKIAVGARPLFATYSVRAQEFLNEKSDINANTALEAGKMASEHILFGTNYLATAEYRQEICKVITKRAIMEVIR